MTPSTHRRQPVTAWLLFRMTRPGFLVATLVGCVLGIAAAAGRQAMDPWLALATVVLGVLAHASANVWNDYQDALNGADAANTARIFPFSGGARFIQEDVVSVETTRRVALGLAAVVVAGGLWLALQVGPVLVAIGLVGMLIGWAYSAPPLALMSRGVGEVAIALAWSLVVVGAAVVQTTRIDTWQFIVSASYALMMANILLIAGFPDAASDAAVGKRTLVVRLGPERSVDAYLAIVMAAHLWVVLMVFAGQFPSAALAALASALPAGVACWLLWRARRQVAMLKPAIMLTIAAAVLHGVLLAAAVAVA
ncbi:MAG: hypothetical protein RL404_2676 [Pseudomonadota bacterium]